MLKIASHVLRVVMATALFCAFVVWARARSQENTEAAPPAWPALAAPPAMPAEGVPAEKTSFQWGSDDWGWDWDKPVHDEATVHKTFTVAPANGHREIEIDNIWGSIEVTGGDGDTVQMDVDESYHAESAKTLERAKKEYVLNISQDSGSLKAEAKFPDTCESVTCWHSQDYPYAVEMNFKLQVPRDSDLTLKTVNGHEVRVRDVNGTFSIHNVNGEIMMDRISGSGTARSVNGPIKVAFSKNPTGDSSFGTVNGSVTLRFPKDLAADFQFRTFSGSIDSDFAVLADSAVPQANRHGTAFYFRTNAVAGGRVGAGGPVVRVENLNGDIHILENHE
jgi:hypothetical protein